MTDKKPLNPYLGIGIGLLAVSTASVFIRYAQNDAPSIIIATFRLGFASLILAPIALRNHKQEIKQLKGWDLRILILSGFFLALHFASWITSLEYTSVTSSVVLVSTSPLWVAIASPIFLKEKVPWQVYIGLVVALIGGLLVSSGGEAFTNSDQGAMVGNILALIGGITGAGYLLVGRRVRENISLIPYIFIVYSVCFVFLLIMSVLMGASFTGYQPQTYLFFLALAVFPQVIGHSSFNWALKYLPAAFVSVTLLGEPVGSAILAMIFLQEIPSPPEMIGAILILIGVYYVSTIMNKDQSANKITN